MNTKIIAYYPLLVIISFTVTHSVSAMYRWAGRQYRAELEVQKYREEQSKKPLVAEIARAFADKVDLSVPDKNTGNTLLHRVAKQGAVDLIKPLIDAKANIDGVNSTGLTALHVAAENRKLLVMRLLLYLGADYHLTTPAGLTACDILSPPQSIEKSSCAISTRWAIENVRNPDFDRLTAIAEILKNNPKPSELDCELDNESNEEKYEKEREERGEL